MTRKNKLKIYGSVIGLISIAGILALISLLLPYFSMSIEVDGKIVTQYWKDHYFDNGVGVAYAGLFIVSLLGCVISWVCLRNSKKMNSPSQNGNS